MKRTGFTLLLVFVLIFLNVFQMFGSIATFAYDTVNGAPPFDSPEYDAWKQRYVSEDEFLNGTSAFAALYQETAYIIIILMLLLQTMQDIHLELPVVILKYQLTIIKSFYTATQVLALLILQFVLMDPTIYMEEETSQYYQLSMHKQIKILQSKRLGI